MYRVIIRYDKLRKCGWRKMGGLYIVTPPMEFHVCEKLPIGLGVCPTCNQGIKFSRIPHFINLKDILKEKTCDLPHCQTCVLSNPPEKALLIWIGKQFYKTPSDWIQETREMGVSRRIPFLPKGFEIGKTMVVVAHVDAKAEDGKKGAIFQAFIPSAIEYLVKPEDTTAKLERLAKKGVTIVSVVKEPDLYPKPQAVA